MKKYIIIINKILIGHTNLRIRRAVTCTCDLWPATCVLYLPCSHGWLRIELSMLNAKWISMTIIIAVVLSTIMIGCSRSWSNIHVTYQRSQLMSQRKWMGTAKLTYWFVIEILDQLGNDFCICFRLKLESFGHLLKYQIKVAVSVLSQIIDDAVPILYYNAML